MRNRNSQSEIRNSFNGQSKIGIEYMLQVGLTGSIGVGKSYVAGILAELGCHVLDADQTARAVVEKGTAGLKAVVDAFGPTVLQTDGSLDRRRLGAVIFADHEKRKLLNSILHPQIIAAQDEQMRQWQLKDPCGIAVVDAALMVESGGYTRFDKLIVVHCEPEVQLQRLMARDELSREEALKRVASQMSQSDKKKFGDYLIDTSEGFEDTRRQTTAVYEALIQLAKRRENRNK
jgi:dephospho-CoA kinase